MNTTPIQHLQQHLAEERWFSDVLPKAFGTDESTNWGNIQHLQQHLAEERWLSDAHPDEATNRGNIHNS